MILKKDIGYSMLTTRRSKIRLLAILGLLAYAVVRFIFVRATFESYGVSAWLFLGIDCATTVTYVVGIEQLVRSFLRPGLMIWWQTGLWGVLAAASFAAPYVYIFVAGNHMPSGLTVGLAAVVVLLAANAVAGVVKRMRKRQPE